MNEDAPPNNLTLTSPKQWYDAGINLPPADQLKYYARGMAWGEAFHPWAQCGVGTARYRLKQYGEAIRHLTAATQLAPTFTNAWNNLGLAREGLHDWAGAEDAFEHARAFDPGSQLIINNLREAQAGLARQKGQVLHANHLSRTTKPLFIIALAGAILGAVVQNGLAFVRLFAYSDYLYEFLYFAVLPVLAIVQMACVIAGLVGLWIATGRPRPWLLVIGIGCTLTPLLGLLFINEISFCAYAMLNVISYGAYLATYGMALPGKTLPKVAFVITGAMAIMDAAVSYSSECTTPWLIFGYGSFMTFLAVAGLIQGLLGLVATPLNVVFWVTSLQQPPFSTTGGPLKEVKMSR